MQKSPTTDRKVDKKTRNVYKPKRQQTETSTKLYFDRHKRQQTKSSTIQNVSISVKYCTQFLRCHVYISTNTLCITRWVHWILQQPFAYSRYELYIEWGLDTWFAWWWRHQFYIIGPSWGYSYAVFFLTWTHDGTAVGMMAVWDAMALMWRNVKRVLMIDLFDCTAYCCIQSYTCVGLTSFVRMPCLIKSNPKVSHVMDKLIIPANPKCINQQPISYSYKLARRYTW